MRSLAWWLFGVEWRGRWLFSGEGGVRMGACPRVVLLRLLGSSLLAFPSNFLVPCLGILSRVASYGGS
ncbi:hypothetical protein V6N12_068363 [Hibiscus sabdariffa]|uniref:Uncharacterized protein n=1 Tax=Hibiscus sabdariffa TaxID=183260 RepID=A0ABR2FPZ9_9ROSI